MTAPARTRRRRGSGSGSGLQEADVELRDGGSASAGKKVGAAWTGGGVRMEGEELWCRNNTTARRGMEARGRHEGALDSGVGRLRTRSVRIRWPLGAA
jgi:hypothetical protein